MRIFLTGAEGQLGQDLQNVLKGTELFAARHREQDVTDPQIIKTVMEYSPDLVIHAAACTDVDGCETNPDMAFRVNALGTRNLAVASARVGATLVYISTDYVFDGATNTPYREFDSPNPLNVYGRSKLAGEEFVRSLCSRFFIVRSAWLYGKGRENFVTRILHSPEEEIQVVTDQVGSPTWTGELAHAISRLVVTDLYGVYHAAGEGECSRYELARAALDYAGVKKKLRPVSSRMMPRPARRPPYSALRNFCLEQVGIRMRPWEEALEEWIGRSLS